jgi:hypothetical protein
MKGWLSRLRFLWEEEATPADEVPRAGREEPTGVPRPLRIATRWALIAVAATTLMAQVIGTRLVAPVDAATSYNANCSSICDGSQGKCDKTCAKNDQTCLNACAAAHQTCLNNCQTCGKTTCP